MRWDALLLLLYGIAVIFIIVQFSQIWNISLILMFILLISLIQKIYFDKNLEKTSENKRSIVDVVSMKMDMIVHGIDDIKNSQRTNSENIKSSILSDIETLIIDLRRRVVDAEGKLIDIKDSIDTSKTALERRIGNLEKFVNISDEDNN